MADSGSIDADAVAAGVRAARALGESRNNRGAADALKRVLGQAPDHVEAHYLLGLYLHNLGKNADAIAECRAAVALDPADAIAHRLLGIVLTAFFRDKRQGLEHLRQAVRLGPQDGFNHYFLARGLAGAAQPKAARTSYFRACELGPNEPLILAGTAEFLFSAYDVRKAEDFAARALAADPDDLYALTARARLCLIRGRATEARDLARTAVQIHAGHRPAIALLIEAEMCRNPYFAVWSRLKGWCAGGKLRSSVLLIGASQAMLALVIAIATWLPDFPSGGPAVAAACAVLATLPNSILKARIEKAMKPTRLSRRF